MAMFYVPPSDGIGSVRSSRIFVNHTILTMVKIAAIAAVISSRSDYSDVFNKNDGKNNLRESSKPIRQSAFVHNGWM